MLSIAWTTFLFFWRNNVIRLILLVSIFFLLGSLFFGQLALSEQSKIVIDFALLVIEVFALILTLFFGSTLLFQEKKQKTLQLILLKDHRISSFIMGKFLGFALVLLLYFIIFLVSYVFLSIFSDLFSSETWIWSVISIGFIYLKMLLVLALVMFFSSFVSPVLSLISSLVVYLVSHVIGFLKYYVHGSINDFGIFQKGIIDVLYYILPNFEQLSMKEYLFVPLISSFSVGNIFVVVFVHVVYIFLLLFLTINIYYKSVHGCSK